MKTLLLLAALSFFSLSVKADCPTNVRCPEHNYPGTPTGQYMSQGGVRYSQFEHPIENGRHIWWERCN
jgi:hypothetical protein